VTAYPLMRDHFIAVYPADTQRVLSMWDSGVASQAVAARLERGLPIPGDAYNTQSGTSLFFTEVVTMVRSSLQGILQFYRGELAMWGWEEEADTTELGALQARLSFRDGQDLLDLELVQDGEVVSATLVHRQTSMADAAGLLPDAGQGRIILGNSSTEAVVIEIDDTQHSLPAGKGGRDPADAVPIQLRPGDYRVAARGLSQLELTLGAGEIWAIMLTPQKRLVAIRAY
jgi:hypothetical protein